MSTNNPYNSLNVVRGSTTTASASSQPARKQHHGLLMGRRIIDQQEEYTDTIKDDDHSTALTLTDCRKDHERGPEVIIPFSNRSHQQVKKRIRASAGFQVNLLCSEVYDEQHNSELLTHHEDDLDHSQKEYDLITPLDSKLPDSCFPMTKKRIKHHADNQTCSHQNIHTKYLEINSTSTSCAPSIIESPESPQQACVPSCHLPSDIIEIIFNFMEDSSRKIAEWVSIDFHRACLQVEKRDLFRLWNLENSCLLKPLNEDTVSPILITQLERKFQVILPYHLKTFLIELSDGRASWHNKFLHVSNMLLPISEWRDEGEQVKIGETSDGSTLIHLCKQNGSLWFKHTKHSEIVNFKNWIQMKKKHFYHVHYNIGSILQRESLPYSFHTYREIPSSCNFKTIVKAMVTQNGSLFRYANDTLKDDEEVALCAIQNNSSAFHECSAALKDNVNIAKAAVKQNGFLLQHISQRLRDEFDIVELAIRNRPMALQYASTTLKKNPILAYLAATTCGDVFENALQFAGVELRANKEFMATVLNVKGICLKYASDALKDDVDTVFLAVNQKGTAIQYATPTLKRDLTVISAAVFQDARSLKYTPESIKSQKQFILDMIELNPKALEFVPDHFRHDREVVLNAVQRDGMTLYFASKTLRGDLPIVLAAISQTDKALQYATYEVQHEINQQ